VLQFSSATYSVAETAGSASIAVTRSGGFGTTVTENCRTRNGTPATRADYTAAAAPLKFAATDTTKTFVVPILNDTTTAAAETIILPLSSPSCGAELGSRSPDSLPTRRSSDLVLQFSSATYSVAETAGSASITVTRTGGFGTTVT